MWLHWTWRGFWSQAISAWRFSPPAGTVCSVGTHWRGFAFSELRCTQGSSYPILLAFSSPFTGVKPTSQSGDSPCPLLISFPFIFHKCFPPINLLYFWFRFGSFFLDNPNRYKYVKLESPSYFCVLTTQYPSPKAAPALNFLRILPEFFIHIQAFHIFLLLFPFLCHPLFFPLFLSKRLVAYNAYGPACCFVTYILEAGLNLVHIELPYPLLFFWFCQILF